MNKMAEMLKKGYVEAKKKGVPLDDFKDLQKYAKEVEQMEKEFEVWEKKLAELKKIEASLIKKMEEVHKQSGKWDKALQHVKNTLKKHQGAQDFFQRMNIAFTHIEALSKKEKLEALKKR